MRIARENYAKLRSIYKEKAVIIFGVFHYVIIIARKELLN